MSAPLYLKLGFSRFSLAEFASRLSDLLIEKGSAKEVAGYLQTNPITVRYWCKKLGIPFVGVGKKISEGHRKEPVTFTQEQKRRLIGLLLGDGRLYTEAKETAYYIHSSKHPETLYKIQATFEGKNGLTFGRAYLSQGVNKKTCRPYEFWQQQSYAHRELKPIHERWYRWEYDPKKKKERYVKYIPEDIELPPETLYEWYVGDGCISNGRYIHFCTQGFSDQCRKILRDRLHDLNIKTTLPRTKEIHVQVQSTLLFFEIIGPCLNPEYQYKWKKN